MLIKNILNYPEEEMKMAKAKAKWLEEATNVELLGFAKEGFGGDDKASKKAEKAIDELIERTPEDGDVSVEEAIEAAKTALDAVKSAYDAELEAMDEDGPDAEESEDDDEEEGSDYDSMSKKELINIAAEETDVTKKELKKMSKEEIIELLEESDGDSDDEEEEDDASDYEDMTKKELAAECKERGLKAGKKDSKEKLIALLEADDEE